MSRTTVTRMTGMRIKTTDTATVIKRTIVMRSIEVAATITSDPITIDAKNTFVKKRLTLAKTSSNYINLELMEDPMIKLAQLSPITE